MMPNERLAATIEATNATRVDKLVFADFEGILTIIRMVVLKRRTASSAHALRLATVTLNHTLPRAHSHDRVANGYGSKT